MLYMFGWICADMSKVEESKSSSMDVKFSNEVDIKNNGLK